MKKFLPVFSIVGITSTIVGLCLSPFLLVMLVMMGDADEPTLWETLITGIQFLVLPYLGLVLGSWGLKLLTFRLPKGLKWGIIGIVLLPFFIFFHYRYLYHDMFYLISALASFWFMVEVFYEKALKNSTQINVFFGCLPIVLLFIFLIGFSFH